MSFDASRALPARGLLLFALLVTSTASAQTSDDRAYVGFTTKRGTSIGSHGVKLEEQLQLELRPMLPSFSLGHARLVPILGFETRWMGMQPRTPPLMAQEDQMHGALHRFQLGLTLVQPLAPRWLLMVGATGSARTDFSMDFDFEKDTSWAAFVMANYFLGGDPRMTLTLGAVAQYPFEQVPIFPLVGFAYRKDPFILELGVPRATLLMKWGSRLELGFTGAFERQIFRIDLPGDLEQLGAHYAQETSLRFGPTMNVRLGSGPLWLSSSVGLDFMNDYALLDRDRERIAPDIAAPTKPAPYLRFQVSWRPPHRPAADARPAGVPAPGVEKR
ncbi:hypothetical protein LXT21_43175 [Myxococcus sp. K38C18041901]|uniref:hypothetical protein n=1 Tax=Myxococcus guangdongensis TaxID=2906760 RepID=UPI0020A7C0CF|nr:hypothetical protein [Myxococcus guangdongensis]MCP3065590.1 hypothetical protein [Myxococcus guangdongensis]